MNGLRDGIVEKFRNGYCRLLPIWLKCSALVLLSGQHYMANSAQARKRARQAVKNRAHNASLRTAFRTAVKKVLKAVEAGDKAVAQTGSKSLPVEFARRERQIVLLHLHHQRFAVIL